jgi:hypothetical protein
MLADSQTTEIFVGIVGARSRCSPQDERFVWDLVNRLKMKYGERLNIVSGGCKAGADAFAKGACRAFGISKYIEHPVEGNPKNKWEFRKEAYARNTLVARDSLDAMFALVQTLRKGGTEDTVTKYQNLIIEEEKSDKLRRRLYTVFPDMSVELWTQHPKELSKWTITDGTVSQAG